MSIAITQTHNTMGVRRLMSGTQRSFRSSRPRMSGYVLLGRLLGDDTSFRAGTPLTPDPAGDVYSEGFLPTGQIGGGLATVDTSGGIAAADLGYVLPQPAAPAGSPGPQMVSTIVGPQAQPAAPSSATSGSGGGQPGGMFPLWVGIAVLVAAAIILPPLIKKL